MLGKIQVMSRMSREMQVDMSRLLRKMMFNMRRTLYEMQVDLHRMMREMHVEIRSRMLREKQADLNRMPHNRAKAAMEYFVKEEFDRLKLDMMGTDSEQLRENLVELTRMVKTAPSPIPVPTESPGSPLEVYTARQKNNPFQVCEDDDDEDSSTDSGEENDILLADNRDQSCQFSAMLDEVDVAAGFHSLFTAVKKKTVYIHDIDEALCGIILLSKKGTELQTLHFGDTTLVKMREKALAKWQNAEATAGQNQLRALLGTLKDHGDDREKSRKYISENAPSNVYQKLWAYLVTAIAEFPKSDSSKTYSESTAISSYILPLCRAFMSMPNKSVFVNFIDATTVSGRLRNGSSSRKEPDMALEIKDSTNKTICEVGIGEVTSYAQKCNKKKNAKDLVRVGHSLKDALDFIQDEYSVHDTVLVGWQVIGQTMAIYLMFKCGNLYIMVHARDVTIPDNLTELGTISSQFKIWNDLRATVEEGLNSVLEAVVSGKGKGRVIGAVGPVGSVHARIETTRTPEFKTFLNRV
ncbi:hypothetical protein BGX24_011548 [Mortierella sp. AD032]|nr:hypothetical protein BGX24_011548 [Mortierella sp. AD032]